MTRTPLRLPVPGRLQRILRTPPVSGMTSPASGFAAMKSTNARRSSSFHRLAACRKNGTVSTIVISSRCIFSKYAIGVYLQAGLSADERLTHPPPVIVGLGYAGNKRLR